MVSRGFAGVARYGADTGVSAFGPRFVIETPQAGKAVTYLSKLHRPPIISGLTAGTRTAKVVDWVGRQGAKVQGAAVKAAGSMSTGITGGAVSGATKGLAKQVFSKAGLAAGFAVSGAMDGGEAIWDFAHSDGHMSDLKADDWKKIAAALPSRLGQGLLRAVDGMLFGLPSFIPGYHDLAGGDDYMTGEYSRPGSARDNYKKALKLAGGPDNISAADWAKLSAKYEREKEDAYMNGIDEDGFAESGVTQDELARRRRDVEGMRARRKATADWRAAMLYDFDSKAHPEGPDVQSLRNAVMALAGRHEQRIGDLARAYGDNDSFVSAFTEMSPGGRRINSAVGFRDWDSDRDEYVLEGLIRRGDTEGLTAFREKKLGFALQRRTKEMDREFSRLQKFRGFDTLVDAVRQEASDVYHRVARTKGYAKDEAAQGFDELWSGMSDFQRASLDTVRFAEMLSANPTEGQEEPK